MLEYKGALAGIKIITTEEAYTSIDASYASFPSTVGRLEPFTTPTP
ncbi:MAG: transposase [Iphinoe sp. HA4291-MV1]|nr:transposase [Iphinoe sp. HA4291-MV1]